VLITVYSRNHEYIGGKFLRRCPNLLVQTLDQPMTRLSNRPFKLFQLGIEKRLYTDLANRGE
jgi:hypothetical protein